MNISEFESKILKRRLEPLEAVHAKGKTVRWFVCRNEEYIIVYDADGYAYSSPYSDEYGEEVLFIDDKPCYGNKAMCHDDALNIK